MILTAEAFAKVNLSLRVLGRRADGYHELDTVFQAIDLADRLTAEEANYLAFLCDDPSVPGDERNLVVQAARSLAERAGMRPAARLVLSKRIPAGSGLGGGSSDAAAAIALLARLWRLPASRGDLAEVAAGVGSDVPFFLWGGRARGTGRGERIAPLPDGPELSLIVLLPPFPVATAAVYARHSSSSAGRTAEPPAGPFGGNDLTPSVLAVEPRMENYLSIMRGLGPAQISGSGSAIVGLPDGGASEGASLLRSACPEARVEVVRTLSRPEYARRSTMEFS